MSDVMDYGKKIPCWGLIHMVMNLQKRPYFSTNRSLYYKEEENLAYYNHIKTYDYFLKETFKLNTSKFEEQKYLYDRFEVPNIKIKDTFNEADFDNSKYKYDKFDITSIKVKDTFNNGDFDDTKYKFDKFEVTNITIDYGRNISTELDECPYYFGVKVNDFILKQN